MQQGYLQPGNIIQHILILLNPNENCHLSAQIGRLERRLFLPFYKYVHKILLK